jgi:subtilisin family serine protease
MAAQKIADDLHHLLATAAPHDQLDVNIFLRGEPSDVIPQAAVSAVADAPDSEDALGRLKAAAESAQDGLLSFLRAHRKHAAFTDEAVSVNAVAAIESFWIANAVGARMTAATLRGILDRDDIQFVDLGRHVPIAELLDAKKFPRTAGAPGRKTKGRERPVAWSVRHINAPLCWQQGLTGQGILVAVVDTGVNYKHPDLKKRMWKGDSESPRHGYDFENDNDDPADDNGHGTATAGLVAGDGTSGTRTGVAPEATILAIRVGGLERNFWEGLQFALDRKARVISMSLTWKYPSSPDYPGWRRVCETILAASVLHANSIGNQGDDLTTYPLPFNLAAPGNCPSPWLHPLQARRGRLASPIAVGATDSGDRLLAYSGRGPVAWDALPYNDYPYTAGDAAKAGLLKPDVCAPGPGTISCNYLYPSQRRAKPYRSFGGTSAATPHVAGCLAILAQACRDAGKPIIPARVQEALERTAKRVQGQAAGKENHYGAGRVDVYGAYLYGKKKGWW